MRWLIGSALALALAWGVFAASPYWALWDLATAIQARDADRIARRVNVRAFRLSLAQQLVSEGMASKAVPGALGADAQIAAGVAALGADRLLDQLVTPEGVARLLEGLGSETETSAGGSDLLRAEGGRFPTLWSVLRSARWRGFRNVYFALPPEPGVEPQARLQLRFGRLTWRLVAVDLSAEARRRFVEGVLQRLRGASGPD